MNTETIKATGVQEFNISFAYSTLQQGKKKFLVPC